MLRFHGSHDKVTHELVGYNSRLDELQAAVLRVQLPHLDAWSEGRREAAAHYEAAGLGELVQLPTATAGTRPAWHLYVISSERVEQVASALGAELGLDLAAMANAVANSDAAVPAEERGTESEDVDAEPSATPAHISAVRLLAGVSLTSFWTTSGVPKMSFCQRDPSVFSA